MENQAKKSIFKKWWFWVIVVFVVLAIIGSSSNDKQQTGTQTQTPITAQITQKQYQQVFSFSGNGSKKSEPFSISGDRFKIAYDCKGDPTTTLCTAFVFKVGSSFPQAVMNSGKPIKDETIIYSNLAGTGEYYLDANTMGDFTMIVYDYK